MMKLLLLPLLAGLWSCSAFTAVSHVRTAHRAIGGGSVHLAATPSNDDVSPDNEASTAVQPSSRKEVSRRSAVGRAAAAAALTVGVASPDGAEAFQASLDDQVKAIENANYMVSFGFLFVHG